MASHGHQFAYRIWWTNRHLRQLNSCTSCKTTEMVSNVIFLRLMQNPSKRKRTQSRPGVSEHCTCIALHSFYLYVHMRSGTNTILLLRSFAMHLKMHADSQPLCCQVNCAFCLLDSGELVLVWNRNGWSIADYKSRWWLKAPKTALSVHHHPYSSLFGIFLISHWAIKNRYKIGIN